MALNVTSAHAIRSVQDILTEVDSSPQGLSKEEAAARLELLGPNTLPTPQPTGVAVLFLRQFLSPLIYILLIAALVSLILQETSDAVFISLVLLINALVGTVQEYSAERSADALRKLVTTYAHVLREEEVFEIPAEQVVPGDIVLLEEGLKVPADLRLLDAQSLEIDESLLTGESLPVSKDPSVVLAEEAPLGDRKNMAFAGSVVTRGQGRGVVVATATNTEVGQLASFMEMEEAKPPLLLRMERFTFRIAQAIGVTVLVIFAVELYRGMPVAEVFLESVALAVSAIPEGLPVALTVALAIGMRRMAKSSVIVRRLVAVETLGSCDLIASDKTGTLTMNELTARLISVPGEPPWEVTGEGFVPEGQVRTLHGSPTEQEAGLLRRLSISSVLCNDGFLGIRNGEWVHHGDMVDVALLVMARKAGTAQPEAAAAFSQLAEIPFEAENRFSATLNKVEDRQQAFVKGAPEKLLDMCSRMASFEGDIDLDAEMIDQQARIWPMGVTVCLPLLRAMFC